MKYLQSLCILLLITAAKEVMPNPMQVHPSTPPINVLDDKAVGPVFPGGERIDCTENNDCTASVLGPLSHCAGQYCQCNIGTNPSSETKKCLTEAPTLGSGCEETWQCTRTLGKFVECRNHQCLCTSEAAVVSGKCWKQMHLTEECDNNDECIGGSDTVCTENKCQCILKKVPHPNNDRCLDVANSEGDSCEEDIQCTQNLGDGASCHDGKCACNHDFHYKNQACLKNLILDEPCEHVDGECFLAESFGFDRVKCDKTCVCKDEYHPSSDKKSCLAKGQPDDGSGGGAASITPVFATVVSLLIVKLISS